MYQLFSAQKSRSLLSSVFMILLSISAVFPADNQAASEMRGTKPSRRCAQFQQFFRDMCRYTRDNCQIVCKAVRHPTQISAFTASSPWLVRQIIQPMAQTPKNAKLNILELGFGFGTVTDEIIPLMVSEDRFDGVELNKEWCEQVQARYPSKDFDDVHFYAGGFESWQCPLGESNVYDIIICTLPFTRLPTALVEQCLTKINALLKPGGRFVYITLIGARTYGKVSSACGRQSADYARKMSLLDSWSTANFAHRTRATVMLNVTPAYVHHLVKKEAAA